MNKYKYETIDFGCIPNTEHYYVLNCQTDKNTHYWLLEELFFDECVNKNVIQTTIFDDLDFKTLLVNEMNKRLKQCGLKTGKFDKTHNPVKLDEKLGNEVELLFWAMEAFGTANNYKMLFDKWANLNRCERWWLHHYLKSINKKHLAFELFN